jgi:hypothetical protein
MFCSQGMKLFNNLNSCGPSVPTFSLEFYMLFQFVYKPKFVVFRPERRNSVAWIPLIGSAHHFIKVWKRKHVFYIIIMQLILDTPQVIWITCKSVCLALIALQQLYSCKIWMAVNFSYFTVRPCPAWQRRASTCGLALLPHADKLMFVYVLELCKSEAKRRNSARPETGISLLYLLTFPEGKAAGAWSWPLASN